MPALGISQLRRREGMLLKTTSRLFLERSYCTLPTVAVAAVTLTGLNTLRRLHTQAADMRIILGPPSGQLGRRQEASLIWLGLPTARRRRASSEKSSLPQTPHWGR